MPLRTVLGLERAPKIISPLEKKWGAVSATAQKMAAAWKSFQAGEVPPRLGGPTSRSLRALFAAVDSRSPVKARAAAIHVGLSGLDLQLQPGHRPRSTWPVSDSGHIGFSSMQQPAISEP